MINFLQIAKISYNKNRAPNSVPFEELSEDYQQVLTEIVEEVLEGYEEYLKIKG